MFVDVMSSGKLSVKMFEDEGSLTVKRLGSGTFSGLLQAT